MLGENGTGKTTFIRMIAGMIPPDEDEDGLAVELPEYNISYKPQKISPKFPGTVQQLLYKKIPKMLVHPQFGTDVLKPMRVEELMDQVIKRYIMHSKKTAFIVEHDFIMASYLADRVIVYEGQPGVDTTATSPQPLVSGMNQFLRQLEITFRRDPSNWRPRINKHESQKDKEQKKSGNHFSMEDDNSK